MAVDHQNPGAVVVVVVLLQRQVEAGVEAGHHLVLAAVEVEEAELPQVGVEEEAAEELLHLAAGGVVEVVSSHLVLVEAGEAVEVEAGHHLAQVAGAGEVEQVASFLKEQQVVDLCMVAVAGTASPPRSLACYKHLAKHWNLQLNSSLTLPRGSLGHHDALTSL